MELERLIHWMNTIFPDARNINGKRDTYTRTLAYIKKNQMFPLSYKHTYTFRLSAQEDIDQSQILREFEDQLDNSKISTMRITFDNFNVFYKRHKWLDNGSIEIFRNNEKLQISLTLNFQIWTIISVFVSAGLILMNTEKIWFGIIGTVVFWIFHALLYLWTALTFGYSIQSIVKQQRMLTKAKKTCPSGQIP